MFSVSRTESSFKMKLSPAVTPRTSLRFLAVSVMFCAILVNIFALEKELARKPREEDRVFNEGTEVGEKQSKLYRDRRTVKNNATPNLSDFANRLKDLEERYDLNSAIRYHFECYIFYHMDNVQCRLRATILNSNFPKMVDLLTSFTVFTKPQQERTYDDQTISSVGEKV